MLSQFNVTATVIIGPQASGQVGVQAKRLGARRALLVTDGRAVQCGLAEQVAAALHREGVEAVVFADVQPDPTDRNVRAGLVRFREGGCDCVVGLGGGSPLDAAKVIAVMTRNPEPLSQYAGLHKIPAAGAPLIAIPTTAGTGSEVTKVAVITDTERDVKMMMLDLHLLPTVALVDYELTMSMPPALTAHVGVDTLVHGIEAYVSKKANGLTDPIALSCIRLVAENLETAFADPDNRPAREAMMLASCQGGMAFANSSVCLVHGMSRPLGALFHVPHGLSNAVLLPAVTAYSIPGAPARYATIARTMKLARESDSVEKACAALVEGLRQLNQRLNIPRLGACVGVDRAAFDQQVEKMASDALASGSPGNNPLVPDVAQIVALYRESW